MVVDSFTPSLKKIFQQFLAATANQTKVEEDITTVLEGFSLSRAYPCLCSGIGLCGKPVKNESYAGFLELMGWQDEGLGSCSLGKNLEMEKCNRTGFGIVLGLIY